ncbi:MAG: alkaline phosphatase [Candidatus Wallbacteria bacterium]
MKKFSSFILAMLFLSTLIIYPADSGFGKDFAGAKNVILLIGDGFGPSHFRAAQLYSQKILKQELNMVNAMNNGHTAYLINDTADSTVTESAAAAGQIATGQKMYARSLSIAEDGKTPVKTILEMAKEKGLSVGLVTTSGITDATPGGFSAHVPSRYDEEKIAEQQLALGIDVLMGGRKQFFLPKTAKDIDEKNKEKDNDKKDDGKRKDGRNLMLEARNNGYTVVETSKGLNLAPANSKILGLFNMANMSSEIDRAATLEPSLAEMTEKALQVLSKNKNGFFAMIEGGRIDHASHRNDTAAMIHEVLAFDKAIGAALNFAKNNPDTLIIVTSDHETGGFAMIGNGKTNKEYIGMDFEAVSKVTASFESILKKIKKNPTPENVKAIVKKYMSIELTDEEANIVATDSIKKMDPYNYTYEYLHSLAFVLRTYFRAGWTGATHTAEPIYLYGTGPGSEMLKGLIHNTDLFTIMKTALNLK